MTEEPTGSTLSAPATPQAPVSGGSAPAPTPGAQSVSLDSGAYPEATPSANTPTAGSTPPAPAGGSSASPSFDALPKSWRKEMEPQWAGLNPAVRQYVHEREQQVMRGIQQYARGHDSWSKLTEPFQEVLQQHPGVNPIELFGQLGHNHLTLLQAEPAQKVALAREMLQFYGIDPAQLVGGQPAPAPGGQPAPQSPFTPEQMAAIQRMFEPVTQQVQSFSRAKQEEAVAAASKRVDAFFSDAKNEFAAEVGQDMLQIMQQGQASTLEDAYELAIMRNPETKAKYLAKLAGATQSAGSGAPQMNVKSSNSPATPAVPASMDDTMQAVLNKHYGKTR